VVVVWAAVPGVSVTPSARQTRSLPLTARGEDGSRHAYVDPRLQREVGVRSTLSRLGLTGAPTLAAVAGVPLPHVAHDFDTSHAVGDATVSAAAIILLLTDVIEAGAQHRRGPAVVFRCAKNRDGVGRTRLIVGGIEMNLPV